MMNQIKELKLLIASSLYSMPGTEEEFMKRDFIKGYALSGVQRLIMQLEKDGAIFYKGEKMYVYKKWGKQNLKD